MDMDMDPDPDALIKVTVGVPRRLMDRVRDYARGDGTRPPATINATVAYLLDLGLAVVAGAGPAPPRRGADGEGETT